MPKTRARFDGEVLEPENPLDDLDLGEWVDLVYTRKKRSIRQHHMFFAAIKIAFDNWPEYHPFQPVDADQLRYWLEVKAGYGARIEVEDIAKLKWVVEAFWKKPIFMAAHNVVMVPQSMAYSKMSGADFKLVVASIDKQLNEEVGFGLDQCKVEVITQPGGTDGLRDTD